LRVREKYWLNVWEDRHVFESEPVKGKKKLFVTVPYPYMNGPVHVGTGFTSVRVDIYARFKRMQGYNVLFPWAWHWTGQTIVGLSYRLKKGDAAVRRAFVEIDGVPEHEVERFTDPEYLASYYTKVSRQVIRDTGFSIDWRREFRTIDPAYKKFVEWQYLRLRDLGYVVQATHPVVWCSHDQSPTGDHDRMEGEGVSPEEFSLIKFQLGESLLVAATLRPETIYGATNIWVNPDAEYTEAKVDNELWIVSSSALTRLSEQKHTVTLMRSFKGREIVGRYAMAPLTGRSLPVLPARFVDPDLGTGVVYSVPAHAPYDYAALRELKEGKAEADTNVRQIASSISPISILTLKGYSDIPAQDIVSKYGVTDSLDPKLEQATEELYRMEYHAGVMKQNSGPLAGLHTSEAKQKAIELLSKTGRFGTMLELPQRVVCRCGTRCYVKVLENQWFLNYSDKEWKKKTRTLIEKASVMPPESREWYYSTIEWLKDWACARRSGMGTRLPWDKEWIVETLSDSTIYMAFYTISKFVNQEKVKPDSLTPEVFDYIFFGKGNIVSVAKKARLSEKLLRDMRDEFVYWYPVDLRNSAKELIPNHLTFFAFHHAALFGERHWPRGFSVNGMIQIEGQKMSKTKGNFVTWKAAMEQFGPDAYRLALALTADGMDDADWRARSAEDSKARVDALIPFVKKSLRGSVRREPDTTDSWLLSAINRRLTAIAEAIDSMKIRRAASIAYLETWNDIRYYLRRSAKPRRQTLQLVFGAWVRMIAPFTPFVAEELHRELGGKGLVSQAGWPSLKDFPVDQEAELAELAVSRVIEDCRSLLKVLKGPKRKITVYVASSEVRRLFIELAKAKKEDIGAILKKHTAAGVDTSKLFRLKYELGDDLVAKLASVPRLDEFNALAEAKEFMSSELGVQVDVLKLDGEATGIPKAREALPLKPAIYIE
jgi:leucyl-tRNA synthetase